MKKALLTIIIFILALAPFGANARISLDNAQYITLNEVVFLGEEGEEIYTLTQGEITPVAYVSNTSYVTNSAMLIEAVYSDCELTYIHTENHTVTPGHLCVPLEGVTLSDECDRLNIMLWDTFDHTFPVSEKVSLSRVSSDKSISAVSLKYEDISVPGFVNRLEKTITFASCPGFTVPMDSRHPLSQKLSRVGQGEEMEIVFETEDKNCTVWGTEISQDIYSGQAFYTLTSPDGYSVRYRAQVMKTTDNAPVFYVSEGDFERSQEIVPSKGIAGVYKGDYDKVCTIDDPYDDGNRIKYTKKFLTDRETKVGLFTYYPKGGAFEGRVRFKVDDISSDVNLPFMRLVIGEDEQICESMTGSDNGLEFINIDYDTYCLGIDRLGNTDLDFSDLSLVPVLRTGKWYELRILILDAGDYIKSEIYIDGKFFAQQKKVLSSCRVRDFAFSSYSRGEFTLCTDDYYLTKLEDAPSFGLMSEDMIIPMSQDFQTPFVFNSEVNKLTIGYDSQSEYGLFSVETDPMDSENKLLSFEKSLAGGNNALKIDIPSMTSDTTSYAIEFDMRISEMNSYDDAVMYWHLGNGVKGYFYKSESSKVSAYIHNGTDYEYVNSFAFEPSYMNNIRIEASKETGPDTELNYTRYEFFLNGVYCDSVMCASQHSLTNGTQILRIYGASARTFKAYIDNIRCMASAGENLTYSAYFDDDTALNKVNDGLCVWYNTLNEYGNFYVAPDHRNEDNSLLVFEKEQTGSNNILNFSIPALNQGTDRYSISYDIEFESMNSIDDAVMYFRLGNTIQGYFYRGTSGKITMYIKNKDGFDLVPNIALEPNVRYSLKITAEITEGEDSSMNYYKYSFYCDDMSEPKGEVVSISKGKFVSGTDIYCMYGASARTLKLYADNIKFNFA